MEYRGSHHSDLIDARPHQVLSARVLGVGTLEMVVVKTTRGFQWEAKGENDFAKHCQNFVYIEIS